MNLLQGASLFTAMAHAYDKNRKTALEKAAVVLEKEAKRVIGTYDYGWPALSPETVARKARGDTPLLETGEMRESIKHTVPDHKTAYVGSDNDKAVWHELGTRTIPARSFLMGAAMQKQQEIGKELGNQLVKPLLKR